jgi:hypothetical protein
MKQRFKIQLKLKMAQDGGAERVSVSPNTMTCRSGTLWASRCAALDGGGACHELQGSDFSAGLSESREAGTGLVDDLLDGVWATMREAQRQSCSLSGPRSSPRCTS